MGTKVGNFFRAIVKLFKKLTEEVKDSIVIAVTIVDATKAIIENPVSGNVIQFILDFVKNAIPGKLDDVIIDKIYSRLKEYLPRLLLNLNILKEIDGITDPTLKAEKINYYLQIAIADMKFSTEEQRQVILRGWASKWAEILSDGKITWKELGGFTEVAFEDIKNLKK